MQEKHHAVIKFISIQPFKVKKSAAITLLLSLNRRFFLNSRGFRIEDEHVNLLPDDEIHLWKISVSAQNKHRKCLSCLLYSEEQARAKRFISDILTERYEIAQGALRVILAHYLGGRPEDIRYRFGPYKKPFLCESVSPVQFNLSHSNDMVLIAVSTKDEVGVDVELMRKNSLAESILTLGELEAFNSLPQERQEEAFYSAWTHKEALLKLLGTGLYRDMKQLEVPLYPVTDRYTLFVDEKQCSLKSFYVGTNYIGAVASYKLNYALRELQFESLPFFNK